MIVKNKLFGSGGRLRVNMGNIYFQQKKYPLSMKNYRMALDQIPETHRTLRYIATLIALLMIEIDLEFYKIYAQYMYVWDNIVMLSILMNI